MIDERPAMELKTTDQTIEAARKVKEQSDRLGLLFAALHQLPQTDEFMPPRDDAPNASSFGGVSSFTSD